MCIFCKIPILTQVKSGSKVCFKCANELQVMIYWIIGENKLEPVFTSKIGIWEDI